MYLKKLERALFLLFVIFLPVQSDDSKSHKHIVMISIPKCGTNLLAKCLRLLGKSRYGSSGTVGLVEKIDNLGADGFLSNHLHHTGKLAQVLRGKRYAPIFIYRDPRDQVVSQAFYYKKRLDRHPECATMEIPEIITMLIKNRCPQSGALSLHGFYARFIPWMKESNVLSIRFEDLVGAQGGGSDATQLDVVQKIVHHIDAQMSEEELKEVMGNIFGGTHTFRATQDMAGKDKAGQIGSWKNHLTPEHKKLFKRIAGQLLIDLGYEKDFNW